MIQMIQMTQMIQQLLETPTADETIHLSWDETNFNKNVFP